MRSLDKGSHPADEAGAPIKFNEYAQAKPYLEERLGRYCAYCERYAEPLEVEHKQPKARHPRLERDWLNLLLSCKACNMVKSDREFDGVEPLWPDEHDTFPLVEYHASGAVTPRAGLDNELALRVRALLTLVGLDRTQNQSRPSDKRHSDRLERWRLAEQSIRDLQTADSPAMRRLIVENAKARGAYSIWMATFQHDDQMCRQLTAAFPGTRASQHERA